MTSFIPIVERFDLQTHTAIRGEIFLEFYNLNVYPLLDIRISAPGASLNSFSRVMSRCDTSLGINSSDKSLNQSKDHICRLVLIFWCVKLMRGV